MINTGARVGRRTVASSWETVSVADEDPFREAWAKVRAQRAADTPRREATQDAYKAARPLKGRPDREVRAALIRELAERGVDDLLPAQIDVLIASIQTSPTRVAFGLLRDQARRWHGLWTELSKYAAPSWTSPPSKAVRYPWRDEQDVVRAVVEFDPSAGETITRIFAEVPIFGDTGELETPERAFAVWISNDDQLEDATKIRVRVGKNVIGTLSVDDSNIARTAMNKVGAKAINFDAVAWGRDTATGWITVGLPARDR